MVCAQLAHHWKANLATAFEAAKAAPYDFAGSLLFAVGSLLYVATAAMELAGTYDYYNAAWLDVAAPAMDCLSSIAYFRAWQLAWTRRSLNKQEKPFAYLADFTYHGCIFFCFGSVSYLVGALLYACDIQEPFDLDILSSNLLLMSSSLGFLGTLAQWKEDEVDYRLQAPDLPRVSFTLAPCRASQDPQNPKKVFWLFWADVLYIFGSMLYVLYSYVPYFAKTQHASDQLQNVFNMIGSLLFVADCYLYVVSFVQATGVDEKGSDTATSEGDIAEYDRECIARCSHRGELQESSRVG
jgi:hypothetical protein